MLEIIDEVIPDLRGSKFVPFVYNGGVLVTNANTFLNRDVDVEGHIITGIEVDYFNGGGFVENKYPGRWVYNGQVVNTISGADIPKFILTFRGKKNEYLHYNAPLTHFCNRAQDLGGFLRPTLSAIARRLDLDLSTSYLKIVQLPLVTQLPIIIPITYYFDRENIFK